MAEITENEKAIGDNLVTLIKYAKGKLPSGQPLVDYIASEIGKINDDTPIADKAAIDSAFDVAIGVSTEAGVPKVAKLFVDIKKAADDVQDGKGFLVEIADGAAILSDLRGLKTSPAPVPTSIPTTSEGAE